jgi:hypothetical protein
VKDEQLAVDTRERRFPLKLMEPLVKLVRLSQESPEIELVAARRGKEDEWFVSVWHEE